MTEDKKPTDGDIPRKKNMHLVIPVELHRRMKFMCVLKDITLREFAETAFRSLLEAEEEKIQ